METKEAIKAVVTEDGIDSAIAWIAGVVDEKHNRIEQLEAALQRSNASLEYYERKFYLGTDRIEELEAALRLGVDMREKQKAYFKRRFQDVLLDCKKAERDFDVSALAALREKKDG
jgi:hypothetical protein